MEKYTQNELRAFVRLGIAENVTKWKELPPCYEKLGYSAGRYGINGGIYKDEKGNMYVIIAKNNNLYRIF